MNSSNAIGINDFAVMDCGINHPVVAAVHSVLYHTLQISQSIREDEATVLGLFRG